MNLKKFIITGLATGVVGTIYDLVVNGFLLQGPVYSKHMSLFRQDSSMLWLTVANFVGALVFVWFYTKVKGSFSEGWKGGATYGLYAGILINFPTWIFAHLLFNNFSYIVAWAIILSGIGWGIVAGAVAGTLYKN
ncbi:MAG: hypothetical protein IPG76_16125 [Acidobacteria bacterium]|nr:hypothetical protein [Acidobacteriota bacterium]